MDNEKVEELINKQLDYLNGLEPGTEEYAKGMKQLGELNKMRKRSPFDIGLDITKALAPAVITGAFGVICTKMSCRTAVYQTDKVSDLEDVGVVGKSKTLTTISKPRLFC